MATQERHEGGGLLLAGFYNQNKRSEQVLEKLATALEQFGNTDFSKNPNEKVVLQKETPRPQETFVAPKENKITLEFIQKDIDQLAGQVSRHVFPGAHFDRDYRTFQGTCEKLLQDLDRLPCPSANDAVSKSYGTRGEAIERIQVILVALKNKVHLDGKCCLNCPMYGTLWQ